MNMNKKVIIGVLAGITILAVPLTVVTTQYGVNSLKTVIIPKPIPAPILKEEIIKKKLQLAKLQTQYSTLKSSRTAVMKLNQDEIGRLKKDKLPYIINSLSETERKSNLVDISIKLSESIVGMPNPDALNKDDKAMLNYLNGQIEKCTKLNSLYQQSIDLNNNILTVHRKVTAKTPIVSPELLPKYTTANKNYLLGEGAKNQIEFDYSDVKGQNQILKIQKNKTIDTYEKKIADLENKVSALNKQFIDVMNNTSINTEDSCIAKLNKEYSIDKSIFDLKRQLIDTYKEYNMSLSAEFKEIDHPILK